MFMSFSGSAEINILKGATLQQKIYNCARANWGMNTNLELAFTRILDIATKSHIPQDEMVKSLVIISDMEIDACDRNVSFYESMRSKFALAGYDMPGLVFWNVNSRHDTFLTDGKRPNTTLVGGQAASTFKHLVDLVGKTPTDLMLEVLNSERYERVVL